MGRSPRARLLPAAACVLVACAIQCGAAAQPSPDKASPVRVPLAGFLASATPTAQERAAAPLMLTFPPGYVDRLIGSPNGRARIVGLPEDTDKLAQNGESTAEDLKRGVFVVSPAPEIHFDADTRRFSGEDDTALKDKLQKLGATGISLARSTPAGTPVWQVTFQSNGRHVFVAYLPPTVKDGPVVKVSYKHPQVFSNTDAQTWQRFIEGLAP